MIATCWNDTVVARKSSAYHCMHKWKLSWSIANLIDLLNLITRWRWSCGSVGPYVLPCIINHMDSMDALTYAQNPVMSTILICTKFESPQNHDASTLVKSGKYPCVQWNIIATWRPVCITKKNLSTPAEISYRTSWTCVESIAAYHKTYQQSWWTKNVKPFW